MRMVISKAQKAFFTAALMKWHNEENTRSLPWKQEKDPYKIWLSEIILQQTRAEQGLPYYLSFTNRYPTIDQLANAADDDVFRLWQGLGYYNRCKNLLATARLISNEKGGTFPATYTDLLQLKGIGPYTAAAIASFAYNLPHAVLDGNVNRVLARFFGIDIPFDSTEGKKTFQHLAQDLLNKQHSSHYNQAIMDHGATICTPANPACPHCPLQPKCFAYNQNTIPDLPVKTKKLIIRTRYFHYLLLTNNQRLLITKRTAKDIWQNLFEPVLIEHPTPLDSRSLSTLPAYHALNLSAPPDYQSTRKQKLTHQLIETRFFSLHVENPGTIPENQGQWVPFSLLNKYPFPRTLVSFLEKNFYF